MSGKEAFLERRVGRCRMVDVAMAVVILATLVLAVILIATLTPKGSSVVDMSTTDATQGTGGEDCIDVAIIGAGIGGTYTGWKLRERGHTISVFEYSNRVGGREYSVPLPAVPGTYLEFGSMRFRPGSHPILSNTATALGLNVTNFDLGYGNADETIWFTRETRMRFTDLGTDVTPYILTAAEKKDPDSLMWDVFSQNTNVTNTYPSDEQMYSITTSEGTPVHQMSLDNFYGRFASKDVYNYISDASGWYDYFGRFGSMLGLKWLSYPGDAGGSTPYRTIAGGFDLMTKALIEQFQDSSESHKLHLNHQLVSIERRPAGGYSLKFRKTRTVDGVTTPLTVGENKVTVCAKKVVLAMQRGCVEDIDFPPFKAADIVKNLNSVIDIPAGRIFLAYPYKWWKTNSPGITHAKTDLPNRQTYDWQTGSNNVSILMASYHDGPINTAYWRELSQFGTPIPGSLPGAYAVTDVVKERLERDLSRIYNFPKSSIPEAVGGGMMLWDSFPFYAAWGYYKPGFNEQYVREFMHKPSATDDVYIVSNAWARDDFQGWAEGSLEAADAVINKYFTTQ